MNRKITYNTPVGSIEIDVKSRRTKNGVFFDSTKAVEWSYIRDKQEEEVFNEIFGCNSLAKKFKQNT